MTRAFYSIVYDIVFLIERKINYFIYFFIYFIYRTIRIKKHRLMYHANPLIFLFFLTVCEVGQGR